MGTETTELNQEEWGMLKVRRSTHKDFKWIAKLNGESIMDLLERVAREERVRALERKLEEAKQISGAA